MRARQSTRWATCEPRSADGAAADLQRDRRRALLIRLSVVAGLIVAMWLVITIGVQLAYADRIMPGTTMAGQSLGGRSPEAAQRILATALASPRPATLTAAGRRFVVDPAQVGYRINVSASVDVARDAGRRGPASGLVSTIPSLIAPSHLEPVARVDRARLAAQIADIARVIDRPARAGTVRADGDADGEVRVTAPQAQRTLQRAAASRVLLSALHERRAGPVALPVRSRGGATLTELPAVARRAREYLSTPVQLSAGRRTLTLTTRQTAALLALRRGRDTGSGALTLGVESAAVARLVDRLARDLNRAPADARISAPARPRVAVEGQGDIQWRPRKSDISVTPGTPGRQLQRTHATVALRNAVRLGRHRIELSLRRTQARLTTAAAREVTSLLGTFTTRYACCQPRVTNIRLMAEAIDGTVVMPGQRFSLNASTGERTRAGGYVKAPFIADGELVASVGGGVSQVSTTLYNAAYLAGVRIDAHRPHSFYIDRYPPGREATLNFPDIDLRWTNDTSAPVLIRAATDQTSVTVSLYGTNTRRRVRAMTGRRIPLESRDFEITVTRVVRYRDGKVIRQPYTSRYDRPPPPE